MSIDWITVAAQIVNFLMLVWLLKRFLYRPILDGIDAREATITARMAEAATIREEAEAAAVRHTAEIARLKASREDVLTEAREAAEAERSVLLTEARARLERERVSGKAEREEEARRYTDGLHRKGASALVALTRKALNDLSGETLEERIVARATTRLPEMVTELRAAAGDAPQAVVTTCAPLSDDLRSRIAMQLTDVLPDATVRYATDPAQSPGLSLRLGGAQLGWTVDDYIEGLDRVLVGLTTRKDRPDAA